MVRLAAGLEHGWVYANVVGVTISDPDCYITVGVMFWFAYFSVVFFIHEIYIRRRRQWCLRLTVSHFHLIILLRQGKDSFPFYGTFKAWKLWVIKRWGSVHDALTLNMCAFRIWWPSSIVCCLFSLFCCLENQKARSVWPFLQNTTNMKYIKIQSSVKPDLS